MLADDAVVIVKGRVDKRDDQPKLIAMDIELFEPMADGSPPLRVQVPPDRAVRRVAHRGPQASARRSTPATRRCSSTSASARCCGCPTTSTVDVAPALLGASSGCCSAPTAILA